MAVVGLARVKMVDGDLTAARLMLQSQLATTATPDLASAVGELSSAIGDATAADQYYQMAEQIERAAWGNGLEAAAGARADPERASRARAPRRFSLPKKRRAARADIDTMDTLAWAYFKNGQIAEAQQGVGAGVAHRHAQRPHPLSCGGDSIAAAYFFAACTWRHSSLP